MGQQISHTKVNRGERSLVRNESKRGARRPPLPAGRQEQEKCTVTRDQICNRRWPRRPRLCDGRQSRGQGVKSLYTGKSKLRSNGAMMRGWWEGLRGRLREGGGRGVGAHCRARRSTWTLISQPWWQALLQGHQPAAAARLAQGVLSGSNRPATARQGTMSEALGCAP